MKLIIEDSKEKMSESAMQILLGTMMQDKRVNISLTAGRSPELLYKMMIPYVKDQAKFADVQYYLFDEAPYIGKTAKEDGENWPIEFISLLWTIGKPLMNRFVMPEKSMQC